MRPEDGADAAIEVVPHGVLLARRLAVHVDEDAAHALRAHGGDQPIRRAERAVERLHEHASFEIDHPEPRARRRAEHRVTPPRRTFRIVRRPELPGLRAFEVGSDLTLREGVVPAGQQIQSRAQKLIRALRRDPGPAGRVLRVADAEVEAMVRAKSGQQLPHRVPARLPDDVAHEQDLHRTETHRASVHTAPTRRSCSPTGTSGTSCESKTSATLRPLYADSVAS